MELLPNLGLMGESLALLADWTLIVYVLGGLAVGVVVGSLPGLSSIIAIGVSLPFTYQMEPFHALMFLTAIYTGGLYAGGITAVLFNIPGTSAAVATTFDGYPMTVAGRGREALGIQLGATAFGGLFGYGVAFVVLPIAGSIALSFGPPEILLLTIMAILLVGTVSGKVVASLISGLAGLLLATIGATAYGSPRGTFNITELYDGLPLVPVLMGLLAISELLFLIEREYVVKRQSKGGEDGDEDGLNAVSDQDSDTEKSMFHSLGHFWRRKYISVQSGLIGSAIGMIPAAGSTIAALVSYRQGKRSSPRSEDFGSGEPDGVVAAETANNASEGGSMAVLMSLGIPGSAAAAMIMSAFLIHGLTPGPNLLQNDADLAYALILGNMAGMVLLVVVGLLFVRYLSRLITFPTKILVPAIVVLAVAGSIAVRNTYLDAIVMVVFGLIGYVLRKLDLSIVAMMLGFILGPLLDTALVRTLALFAGGGWHGLLERPLFVIMVIMIFVITTAPPVVKYWVRSRRKNGSPDGTILG